MDRVFCFSIFYSKKKKNAENCENWWGKSFPKEFFYLFFSPVLLPEMYWLCSGSVFFFLNVKSLFLFQFDCSVTYAPLRTANMMWPCLFRFAVCTVLDNMSIKIPRNIEKKSENPCNAKQRYVCGGGIRGWMRENSTFTGWNNQNERN